MKGDKILYVCQEISPYLPESPMGNECHDLLHSSQERGYEVRCFMPKYGVINERRNQLHEVIRLSGMNMAIRDTDHQLIIKVASLPRTREQIYFIDNDDYFARKVILFNPETGEMEPDNDQRALFFARGVMETARKLRWQPSIIHCHGWFSALAPMLARNEYSDDPLFSHAKIVVSLYEDGFEGELSTILETLKGEDMRKGSARGLLANPTYDNLIRLMVDYADALVIRSDKVSPELVEYAARSGKPILPYDPTTENYLKQYQEFYNELLGNNVEKQ